MNTSVIDSNIELISDLKSSVERLFRQNNKLAVQNLELQRQQESMLADIDKIAAALESRTPRYDFQARPSYKPESHRRCRSLDGNSPFKYLSKIVDESNQAQRT